MKKFLAEDNIDLYKALEDLFRAYILDKGNGLWCRIGAWLSSHLTLLSISQGRGI